MAAILTLDDGRLFHASNISISGALHLTGLAVVDHPRLRHWLLDKAEQCAPFFDIDTRGFAPGDRTAFWAAIRAAQATLEAKQGPQAHERPHAYAAWCLHALVAEKDRMDAGEPPPADDVSTEQIWPIDLGETWFDEAGLQDLYKRRAKKRAEWEARRAGKDAGGG